MSKIRFQDFFFGRLLFLSVNDKHHPIRNVKAIKGNMKII